MHTKTLEPIYDTYEGEPVYIPQGWFVKVIGQSSPGWYKCVASINSKPTRFLAKSSQLEAYSVPNSSMETEPPVAVALTPRIYQEYGISFLLYKQAALLSDAPGTGKTLQALEAAYRVCMARELGIDPLDLCYTHEFAFDLENTHPDTCPKWATPTSFQKAWCDLTTRSSVWCKTSQFPEHLKQNPVVVIVAPSHLCNMWFRAIRRQYPNEHVAVATNDTKSNRFAVLEPGCRFYIVNYEMIRPPKDPPASAYEEVQMPFKSFSGNTYYLTEKRLRADYKPPRTYIDALIQLNQICVIFDESHRLKSAKSKQAKACAEFSKHIPYRFLLTATPIKREADDLWMQLHIIDPNTFTTDNSGITLSRFVAEYCFYKTTPNGKVNIQLRDTYKRALWFNRIESLETQTYDSSQFMTGHSNKKYKTSFIDPNLKGYILGRSYKDVGLYLPPVIPAVIPVQMDTMTRKIYDSLKATYRAQLEMLGQTLTLDNYMQLLHGLRVITACPNKYAAVKELVEDNEGPFVMYTEYRPTGELLAKMFDTPFISGSVPESEREQIIQDTLALGKPVVGMGRVIGTGINALADARVIINFENDYTPGERTQRIGRVQRYSPNRPTGEPVLLFDVLVTDSIDEHVYEVQHNRGKSIKDIITVELGL